MNINELFVEGTEKDNKNLIVSFAGNAILYGGKTQLEYVNSLNKIYPECDKYFYLDGSQSFYINGIPGITNSIDETKNYLLNKIKNYEKVCFIGNSAGGYASILFGSLLNINYVIAFIPQTDLNIKKEIFNETNIKFINLKNYINHKTIYKLYANNEIKNIKDLHSVYQCNNIKEFDNVIIKYLDQFNLKKIRDSGDLKKIIFEFIN